MKISEKQHGAKASSAIVWRNGVAASAKISSGSVANRRGEIMAKASHQ